MATLGNAVQAYKTRARDEDLLFLSLDELVLIFNEALQEANRDAPNGLWRQTQTITTAAATRTYALSSDFFGVLLMNDGSPVRIASDKFPLIQTTEQDARLMEYVDTGQGKPTHFWIFQEDGGTGFKIGFHYTPDAVYSIEVLYKQKPTVLTSSSALSGDFPLANDHYLYPVHKAAAVTFQKRSNPNMAAYHERAALEIKNDILSFYSLQGLNPNAAFRVIDAAPRATRRGFYRGTKDPLALWKDYYGTY